MAAGKWSDWYLFKESKTFSIKRVKYDANGKVEKWVRLPRAQYKRYLNDEQELRALIDRLNHRDVKADEAKALLQQLDAFIPKKIRDGFRDIVMAEIPTERYAKDLLMKLERHALPYFQREISSPDPKEWKLKQSLWGISLCTSGKSLSWIDDVVQVTNRFLAYLHEAYPEEYSLIKLTPISPARRKTYAASMSRPEGKKIGAFIEPGDWECILRELHPSIRAYAELGYCYGLRRGESLGVDTVNVRTGHLSITRQRLTIGTFGPLKDRDARDVPHWFCTAPRCYELVEEAQKHPMHPETYGWRWAEAMESLDLEYTLHDLRRTFITRALEAEKGTEKVMEAAGHQEERTTRGYKRDQAKTLADMPYVPPTKRIASK